MCWRGLFRLISYPYAAGAAVKNGLYDLSLCRVHRLDVPVVSVGNLTLGGTGKSPLIAYLVDYFLGLGDRPAILSRGYGASREKTPEIAEPFLRQNDEAAELAERFPDIPYYLSPDRVCAGRALRKEYPARNVLLLDDGFQYRRLHRDLDIVLLDATDPFGGGRLFPRGTLRESAASLARADVVILTRADLVAPEERAAIRDRAERAAPGKIWCEAACRPSALVRMINGAFVRRPFDAAAHSEFGSDLSFCGIGNPDGFFRMLASSGFHQVGRRVYPDHYAYQQNDLDELVRYARERYADALVCTMKDLVKIRRGDLDGFPLFAVEIGMEFLVGEKEFKSRLAAVDSDD